MDGLFRACKSSVVLPSFFWWVVVGGWPRKMVVVDSEFNLFLKF